MNLSDKDKSILRQLAEKQADIASLPVHETKGSEWTRLNGNKPGRPLVWINEIPWHEMDVNGELELQTSDPFFRRVEQTLRRTIYLWNHMPADMIVEATFYSPLVIHDTGFGISEEVDLALTDEKNDVVSRDFHSQIDSEKDLQKIKMPVLTHDEEASERNYRILVDTFGDILTVEKIGIVHS